jgi:ferritin
MAELQWFVTEQVEEEKTIREIVAKLRMVKGDSSAVLDLDRELGARAAAPGPGA